MIWLTARSNSQSRKPAGRTLKLRAMWPRTFSPHAALGRPSFLSLHTLGAGPDGGSGQCFPPDITQTSHTLAQTQRFPLMLPPLSPLSGFSQPALKNQSDIVQKTGKAHWCRAGKTHLLSKKKNVQKEARVGSKCWPEQRAGWSSSISEPMSQWLMTWKYSCWCLYLKSRQLFCKEFCFSYSLMLI